MAVTRTITMTVKEEDYELFLREMGVNEEEIEYAKKEDVLEEVVADELDSFSPNDYSPYVRIEEETF